MNSGSYNSTTAAAEANQITAQFVSAAQTNGANFYVYYENQTNPNWLTSNPSAVAALNPRQLQLLTAAQAQSLSVTQLVGLSATQFASLYPKLTTAQVLGLLNQEIGQLPVASQNAFYNANALNSDIQALMNPGATYGQLFSSAFGNADQIAAQALIALYDNNYTQIGANPNSYKELSVLYNLLLTRSNALISDATIAAQTTAEVNSMLGLFSLYTQALAQKAPAAGSSTDVTKYITDIQNTLQNVVGGIKSLQDNLSALKAIEDNVNGLVLDNTTEATPLYSLLEWGLDGSPNAMSPPDKARWRSPATRD